jgi:hypothetical protein
MFLILMLLWSLRCMYYFVYGVTTSLRHVVLLYALHMMTETDPVSKLLYLKNSR